jgi:hypothetical protein
MFDEIIAALDAAPTNPLTVTGGDELPSVFGVTDLAVATIGAAATQVRDLAGLDGDVVVDRALASSWFSFTVVPVDFSLPPVWDDLAGDYACADGFIRLHTNAANHRRAAIAALGVGSDRGAVERAVRGWTGVELETAVVDEGGCAAFMRTGADWAVHPQGVAVAAEPLIEWSAEPCRWSGDRGPRPLSGLRVLDLTRILAGPVATRFLAGWGADVLRIDPPDWSEPLLEPEVTLGKRCARLDLRTDPDTFRRLLDDADVIVHGYRPGALDALGLTPFDGVIDVAIDAYGWTGPWHRRRGFDSLVQMSSGIAAAGMDRYRTPTPRPLPSQALDHGTGYLVAGAVVRALRGGPSRARMSLARTAELLKQTPGDPDAEFDFNGDTTSEHTAWGELLRLVPPVCIGTEVLAFDRPACPLGSHAAEW